MSTRRARERRNRFTSAEDRPVPQISHSHFLGYVLEDETPEMIMKKFEALERFEKQQKKTTGKEVSDELTEEQARQLFMLTSNVDIKKFTADEEEKLFGDEFGGLQQKQESADPDVDANHEIWDDVEEAEPPKKKRTQKEDRRDSSRTMLRSPPEVVRLPESARIVFKKRTKAMHPLTTVFTRLPAFPVPASWGKMIKPYVRPENVPKALGSKLLEFDIRKLDLESLASQPYQGILMDPPWYDPYSKEIQIHAIHPKDLLKLNFSSKVIQDGFIFMWIEKAWVPDVIDTLGKIGFNVVENLAWIRMEPNNRPVQEPSPYFARSKTTLYFFRKVVPPASQGGKPLELRHQRNSDIIFDLARRRTGLTYPKPDSVYDIIETLLPTANYNPESGTGRLLEIVQNTSDSRNSQDQTHFAS
eukprot:TRINITY_DN7139_c0_g1_i1.p1 TRINITY_DN7139_c0_g1~~TRINITY_DN7139_c0_g1_i1.p1  ORF type:complete len:416 (-),score=75.02 TRINITY_DN7139_c0_g1_i1:133-1380(-)